MLVSNYIILRILLNLSYSLQIYYFYINDFKRRARILSSANDASVKTEQNTNINIKFKQTQQPNNNTPINYPTVSPMPTYSQIPQTQNVNFTQEDSQYPSVPEIQQPGIINKDIQIPASQSFEQILEQKDRENAFLKLLLQVYQDQPLIINSYVICKSSVLMDIIKLLTDCDKVDLVLNEDIACGGCSDNSKLIYISKILITKDDKTTELKYGYNEAYSKLVANGISLKIVC